MVKAKKLRTTATVPTRAHGSDAAFDLYAVETVYIPAGERRKVPTGIALEIPEGYAGFIWPRSGLAATDGLDTLAGVIDAGYRGECTVLVINHGSVPVRIFEGSRIAQISIQQVYQGGIELVDELSPSPRDASGWGSTGQ